MNHNGHHYQHIAENMAFGRLIAPDEDVIGVVYLGAQRHTSLHHTVVARQQNSVAAGDWWKPSN